jgi:hypothetical protein
VSTSAEEAKKMIRFANNVPPLIVNRLNSHLFSRGEH